MAHRRSFFVASLVAASSLASASSAWAIRPDFDGERGIEAQVQLGVGGFANGTQRIITESGRAGVSASPTIVGAGFNFRASVGYRIIPALSVGASFSISPLAAYPLANTPDIYDYGASTLSVGAYARLYFLALTAIPRTTRVEFSSWGDPRRFDPYVSLGVEYQGLTYSQTNRMATQIGATITRTSISAPVGLGFEYRVIQPLAVGLGAVLSPTFGAWLDRTATATLNGNIVTTKSSAVGEDPVNLAWSVGLTVRYTLTL